VEIGYAHCAAPHKQCSSVAEVSSEQFAALLRDIGGSVSRKLAVSKMLWPWFEASCSGIAQLAHLLLVHFIHAALCNIAVAKKALIVLNRFGIGMIPS
jgi:hypothetical protein